MFRPSQNLLFRPMPNLNKFKIHPPLPLNPRESKQLLNLLTTSFRQKLDREHGFETSPDYTEPSQPIQRAKHTGSFKTRRRSNSDSESRPTDRHMRSILTNPLFNILPMSKQSKAERDPMDVFDQALAKGMMDLHYAKICLQAKKREILKSPVISVREGMKDSGAGMKVLRWLVSSGIANDNEFLKDPIFADILMQYVVAEGLQEVVWKWVKRSFEDYPKLLHIPVHDRAVARQELVRPLMRLVKAEAEGHVCLDSAYMCLSRATGYLKGFPSSQIRELLGPPGRYVSYETTMKHSRHLPASESSFDSFLALIPIIYGDYHFQFAHLHLLHPARPSASLALEYLQRFDASRANDPLPLFNNPSQESGIIQLGLDTARFLLEDDRFHDSQWVLSCLRTHFPKRLGLQQWEQLEQAKAEASSLQLLDALV